MLRLRVETLTWTFKIRKTWIVKTGSSGEGTETQPHTFLLRLQCACLDARASCVSGIFLSDAWAELRITKELSASDSQKVRFQSINLWVTFFVHNELLIYSLIGFTKALECVSSVTEFQMKLLCTQSVLCRVLLSQKLYPKQTPVTFACDAHWLSAWQTEGKCARDLTSHPVANMGSEVDFHRKVSRSRTRFGNE